MMFDDLTPLQLLVGGGVFLLALSALAGWRDRRNLRRADLDRVSLINWRPLSAISLMVAIVALSAAAHLWFSA
ncbi:hypothetical protein [Novosphingobium percolationis]|uniref:hypothetical protein n=1 Tax=Novosphingobium percolationis TaxID=2871811 RepID=UPI001CD1D9D8|nr:hypothetical protein [Novosphingobium percolationis]MCH7627529.1 hypothetical protein [Pseudomonadota bacterium]